MPDALLLAVALICNTAGLGWLALGMPPHWRQTVGDRVLQKGTALLLRVLGTAGLATSLALCLRVDYVAMASLVWVMSLAAAGLMVTFTLAWHPRALAPLVAWMPER